LIAALRQAETELPSPAERADQSEPTPIPGQLKEYAALSNRCIPLRLDLRTWDMITKGSARTGLPLDTATWF
jgi:hypothetical protein